MVKYCTFLFFHDAFGLSGNNVLVFHFAASVFIYKFVSCVLGLSFCVFLSMHHLLNDFGGGLAMTVLWWAFRNAEALKRQIFLKGYINFISCFYLFFVLGIHWYVLIAGDYYIRLSLNDLPLFKMYRLGCHAGPSASVLSEPLQRWSVLVDFSDLHAFSRLVRLKVLKPGTIRKSSLEECHKFYSLCISSGFPSSWTPVKGKATFAVGLPMHCNGLNAHLGQRGCKKHLPDPHLPQAPYRL